MMAIEMSDEIESAEADVLTNLLHSFPPSDGRSGSLTITPNRFALLVKICNTVLQFRTAAPPHAPTRPQDGCSFPRPEGF
jgi:hypothetical protein